MVSGLRPSPVKRALETLQLNLPDHADANELFHLWDKAHRIHRNTTAKKAIID